MASLLLKISSLGVLETYPEYLKKKINLSNQVSLILINLGIFYTIFSIFCFPPITFIPLIGIAICLGSLAINYLGGIYLSRLLISLVPLLLVTCYNAYLTPAGGAPVISLLLIGLSFTSTPFLVFDLRERALLFLSSGVAAIIFLSFPVINGWLEMDLDSSLIRSSLLEWIGTFLSIVVMFGSLFFFLTLNKKVDENNEELVRTMNENNQQLQSSQVELKNYIQRIEVAQVEEKKRNWASEGLSELSGLLRTGTNTEDVYDTLISRLVKYLKACQGGLFVVTEDQSAIELAACYAYERKKFLHKRIEFGEGLIGQCYLEKESIYLTEIPQDYVNITSGLGTGRPSMLLIVPLKNNGIVEGFFELASFSPFEPYQMDFVERLGDYVASAINTMRVNDRTRKLLEMTQQQAEEMRASEEEMRQNMEELSATQEEMNRKEKEYLERISQLEGLNKVNS